MTGLLPQASLLCEIESKKRREMNHPVLTRHQLNGFKDTDAVMKNLLQDAEKNKGLNWEGKDINGFKISVGERVMVSMFIWQNLIHKN